MAMWHFTTMKEEIRPRDLIERIERYCTTANRSTQCQELYLSVRHLWLLSYGSSMKNYLVLHQNVFMLSIQSSFITSRQKGKLETFVNLYGIFFKLNFFSISSIKSYRLFNLLISIKTNLSSFILFSSQINC